MPLRGTELQQIGEIVPGAEQSGARTGLANGGRGTTSTDPPVSNVAGSIGCTFDGGGSALVAPLYACIPIYGDQTIQNVVVESIDPITGLALSGSAVINIYKDTYPNFPPTSADAITGASIPTLSSQSTYMDSTLLGWNVEVSDGDTLMFALTSNTTCQKIVISLGTLKGVM